MIKERAAIYIEPSNAGMIGGAQFHAAVLADVLQRDWDIDLLVRGPGFDLKALSDASGTQLESARLKLVLPDPDTGQLQGLEGYDLFVAFSHSLPPRCPARRGLLVVLFPFPDGNERVPRNASAIGPLSTLRWLLREFVRSRRRRRRLDAYQFCVANSRFTAVWTKRRWGIDCSVLYPPVDIIPVDVPKRNLILSVGRFVGRGRSKNQMEMLDAYAALIREDNWLPYWAYESVGAASEDSACKDYFASCERIAQGCGATLRTNLTASQLANTYAEASIFWHATGIANDEALQPERAEHFGMVTVEAMAHGCVPIVVRKGGQPEIVTHGVDGFLCDSISEMRSFTLQLMRDSTLLREMSARARASAARFTRACFAAELRKELRTRKWIDKW